VAKVTPPGRCASGETERDRSSESHFDEEPREGEAPAELPRGSSRDGRPGGLRRGQPRRANRERDILAKREKSASRNTRQIRENDARNFFQLRENVPAVWLAGGSGPTYIPSCRRRGKPTRRPSGPKGSQGPRPARVTGGSDGSLPERVAGAPKGTIRADLRVSSGPGGLVSPRASARDGTAGRLARDDRARKERVPRNSKPCEQGTPRGGLTAFSGFPASWGAAPWEGMGRNRGV
jgi:hypothetical protein